MMQNTAVNYKSMNHRQLKTKSSIFQTMERTSQCAAPRIFFFFKWKNAYIARLGL